MYIGNKLAGQKGQGNPSSCPGEVPEPSEQATAAPMEGPVTGVVLALRPTPQSPPLPRLRPMWLGTVRTDPNRADSLCWVSGSCLPGVKVRKLGFGLRAVADFSPVAEAGAEKT